ncbi:DUF4283 domain-containing protein, partial [Cephalotus follicularis]
KVLTNGPYTVFNHILLVQQWRPNFQTSLAEISHTTVWVWHLELPIKYYDEIVLEQIGRLIGKLIKLDINTFPATKTDNARLCVEIDLRQPMGLKIQVDKITQVIEYEGLHVVYFYCGNAGHKDADCDKRRLGEDGCFGVSASLSPQFSAKNSSSQVAHAAAVDESYGSWMIVRQKFRNTNPKKSGVKPLMRK